jgi:hypothetical protein
MASQQKLLIKRDGALWAEVEGLDQAIAWLHRHQPDSYDWALKYEGYRVERLDGSLALRPYSK